MLATWWIRDPQIEFLGFYIPWFWVIAAAGFVLAWVTVFAMEHLRWTQYIWHLPLFFIALGVIFSSILGLVFAP